MYSFVLPRFPGRKFGALVLGGSMAAVLVVAPASLCDEAPDADRM